MSESAASSAPTIKGLFVNSHVNAVRRAMGDEGVSDLERRYGRSCDFGNLDDVPVREEVKIIEHAFDILHSGHALSPQDRAFQAGRLHFQNFEATDFGKVLFSTLPRDFKLFMLRLTHLAPYVFQNVQFDSEDTGGKSIKVILHNNDYPLEHFQGLFYEWMVHFGLSGRVEAKKRDGGSYEYFMDWNG
ncbi:DUF2378 family protein [bacterium]|nr:DUF2378 family protein [bacterium]